MWLLQLLRKILQHEGVRTLGAVTLATYFLMQAIPQRFFRLQHQEKLQEIQRIKGRIRKKTSILFDSQEYDCY